MANAQDTKVEAAEHFCTPGLALLVQRIGLANAAEIASLREVSKGSMLLQALADKKGVNPREMTQAVAKELGIEVLGIGDGRLVQKAKLDGLFESIDPTEATKLRYIPLKRSAEEVIVGMVDPLDTQTVNKLSFLLGTRIRVAMVLESEILDQLRKLRGIQAIERAVADHQSLGTKSLDGDTELNDLPTGNPGQEGDHSQNTAMIRLVNEMLANAVLAGTSDIHLEPSKDVLDIRFRVDGVLRTYMSIPKRLQPYLTTRIKLLGKMDITERRKPQDGRFRFTADEQIVDIRLSTVPTPIGEKIVMRLLLNGQKDWSSAALGMAPEMLEQFERVLSMHDRLLVVTGPTGSGKSTSLYTGIAELIKKKRHVVTVEDPVEYRFEGITQIQVDEARGVTFASGLRSILRQDPEVILVGEIRDVETAACALQAAQTGHQVLSSLHCNSAASAVTRLLDLGISPSLLVSSLGAVLAQRLVRTLCANCSEESSASEGNELFQKYGISQGKTRRAVGCDLCGGTGFRGRIAIFSLIEISEELRLAIRRGETENRLEQIASSSGYKTLLADGLRRVEDGLTTIEELERVVGVIRENEYIEVKERAKPVPAAARPHSSRPSTVEELKASFLHFEPWFVEHRATNSAE